MTAKTCFKCNEKKPLGEFYRHPQMGDGHLNKCKDCTRKDVREHRNDNLEKVREYDNSRAKLPHRREYRKRYAERFVQENPEKHKAHSAVSNAIRDGRLKKLPCAFCGTPEPVEAHHHDYSKPLDVTWLCNPCHRRFHALERMATYRRDEAA
jgi:hypothetical protein